MPVIKHVTVGKKFTTSCNGISTGLPEHSTVTMVEVYKNSAGVYRYNTDSELKRKPVKTWRFDSHGVEDASSTHDNSRSINVTMTIESANITDEGKILCRISYKKIGTTKTEILSKEIVRLYVHQKGNRPCHQTWFFYRELNTCISVLMTKKTWKKALLYCQSHKGHLLVIPNADFDAFVTSYIGIYPGRSYWIGLSDETGSGVFQWIGEEKSHYRNWAAGSAKKEDMRDNCVEKGEKGNGLWTAASCKNERAFLCERPVATFQKPPEDHSGRNAIILMFSALTGIVLTTVCFLMALPKWLCPAALDDSETVAQEGTGIRQQNEVLDFHVDDEDSYYDYNDEEYEQDEDVSQTDDELE